MDKPEIKLTILTQVQKSREQGNYDTVEDMLKDAEAIYQWTVQK